MNCKCIVYYLIRPIKNIFQVIKLTILKCLNDKLVKLLMILYLGTIILQIEVCTECSIMTVSFSGASNEILLYSK